MHSKCFLVVASIFALALYLCVPPVQAVNVLTYHYDNARTGQNTNETALTLANVNTNTFLKLFTNAVDGFVYAQPLIVTGMTIAGGTHDVVFVATEHDSVYAFDANAGGSPLWHTSFTNAGATSADNGCGDLTPEVGITGTPAIDLAGGTLYVEANTKESGVYVHRLHALNITNGTEKFSGPVLVNGTVSGTGDGSVGGHITFTNISATQFSRPAVLLDHGVVYLSYGSHCDNTPYHGWVFAYNATTLSQTGIWNATPNGGNGAIWQCGNGPAADTNGNVYLETGNGADDIANSDYGQSFVKLTSTNVALSDYFMTYQASTFNGSDADVGAGGPVVLPDSAGSTAHPHLLVGDDKYGDVFLIDRDNMGHFNSNNNNQIVQFLSQAIYGGCWTSPTYFNDSIYISAAAHVINAFRISNGALSTTPYAQSTVTIQGFGGIPHISANGVNNAILWIIDTDGAGGGTPGILEAYNATNITQEIYDSSKAGTANASGPAVKFTVPVVANGKVYIGTQNSLAVYGLNNSPPTIGTQPASQTNYVGLAATFTVSASGTPSPSYQWRVEANGVYANLSNGGQFSGVTSTTLTISNLAMTNSTNYEVVVTNTYGSVTSAPAMLTVLNPTGPSINTQPASQTNYVGLTNTFTVNVSGTPPLSYQWQVERNGVYANLSNGGQFSGVTNPTFSISSLALTNATNYEVVVTNSVGSVTSAPAALTVLTNLPYQTVILADNPVSYWPMQETNGPTIHDLVTTNAGPFNGTLQISTDGFSSGATDSEGKNWGIIHKTFTNSTSSVATDGATFLFGGPGGLTGVPGDTAVYFTNLNGQLNNAQIAMGTGGTGAYEAQLDASVFSVEAWVKVPTYPIGWTSNTYQVPVCGFCQGGTSDGWFMALNTDSAGSGAYGEMFFGMGLGTAATFANEGPSAQVFSGKWVYVVQEQNAAGYTVVYTNGTLLLSNSVSYKPLSNHAPSGEVPMMIGSLGGYYFGGSAFSGYTRCQFWDGGVSHVAYYNYALPAGRVSAHYQAGYAVIIQPPPTPTLSIQPSGTNVSISWTNGFLQQATNVTGPWMDVLPTNETSPQVIAATNSQLFFRASSQP